MSSEISMLSQKQLRSLIREQKSRYAGSVIEYGQDSQFFNEVMKKVGESPVFILQEIVAKNIKEVMTDDSKFNFSSMQTDFFAYGEKWINLPDEKTVQVKDASLTHLRIQDEILLNEHTKQLQAFVAHREQLLKPIIKAMETNNFSKGKEAIDFLKK